MNVDPLFILIPVALVGTILALLSSKRWIRLLIVIPILIASAIFSFGIGQTYERLRTLSNITAPHHRFYLHLRELAKENREDLISESVVELSEFYSAHMQDWEALANKMSEIEARNSERRK